MKTLNNYITEKLKINKDYKDPVSSNELIQYILNKPVIKNNAWYTSKNDGYYSFNPVEYLTVAISNINHFRTERNIRSSKSEEVQYILNVLDGYSKDKLFKAAANCKEYTFLSFMQVYYTDDTDKVMYKIIDHLDMDKNNRLTINLSFKSSLNSVVLDVRTNGDYVVFVISRLKEDNKKEFRAFYICAL